MASPDFSNYVDLTINDLQPRDIYDNAVSYAIQALPDFDPRPGTVEDAMLESMSYVSGLLLGAINRLPNGLMEGLLKLMGFDRIEASFATGAVVFTSIDTDGLVIPAGTQVAFTEVTAEGIIQHIFSTDSEATIVPGNSVSSPIPVTAEAAGVKPVIPDGASLLILTASNKLFSCTFSGQLVQGGASESDTSYFNRGATYLASLSASLATTNQINNYILTNYGDVFRARTENLTKIQVGDGVRIFESAGSIGASLTQEIFSSFDPVPAPGAGNLIRVSGVGSSKFNGIFQITSVGSNPSRVVYFSNTIGASAGEAFTGFYSVEFLQTLNNGAFEAEPIEEFPGHILSFVAGTGASIVSSGLKASIKSDVENKAIAGLQYQVIDPLLAPITVYPTVILLPGFLEEDVLPAVDAAVEEFLSPDNWEWDDVIRKNAVIGRISQVPGVEYVRNVVFSSTSPLTEVTFLGDVQFTFKGVLPIPTSSASVWDPMTIELL